MWKCTFVLCDCLYSLSYWYEPSSWLWHSWNLETKHRLVQRKFLCDETSCSADSAVCKKSVSESARLIYMSSVSLAYCHREIKSTVLNQQNQPMEASQLTSYPKCAHALDSASIFMAFIMCQNAKQNKREAYGNTYKLIKAQNIKKKKKKCQA